MAFQPPSWPRARHGLFYLLGGAQLRRAHERTGRHQAAAARIALHFQSPDAAPIPMIDATRFSGAIYRLPQSDSRLKRRLPVASRIVRYSPSYFSIYRWSRDGRYDCPPLTHCQPAGSACVRSAHLPSACLTYSPRACCRLRPPDGFPCAEQPTGLSSSRRLTDRPIFDAWGIAVRRFVFQPCRSR